MKKFFLVFLSGLFVFYFSIPSIAMAASVGNIAETQGGFGQFSIGVEYDGLFNRDMKLKSGSYAGSAGGVTTHESYPFTGDSIRDVKMKSNRIFLKGSVGVHSNIDFFVKLGMADAKWEQKYLSPGLPDDKDKFNGDYGFAWGFGAKAKIFETSGGLRFMTDAQYLSYKVDGDYKVNGTDLKQVIMAEDPSITTASYKSKTKIQEWQVALYVNQTFRQFSPYAGLKYSDATLKNEIRTSFTDSIGPFSAKFETKARADKNFGVFIGTDIYVISSKMSVNIEGRFIDETAVTIGMNYRF